MTATETPTLADYLKAPTRDAAYVEHCQTVATGLVDRHIGGAAADSPEFAAARWQAILVTGANLWTRRRRLVEGSAAMSDGMVVSSPDRPTRDPLDAARHILGTYLGPGIA